MMFYGVTVLLMFALGEAKPDCSTSCTANVTSEGDSIDFSCGIQHLRVNGTALTWKYKESGLEPQEVRSQEGKPAKGRTWLNFSMKAVAPEVVSMVCRAKASGAEEASCETKPCKILYSVRNVITTPAMFVSPGEEITCTAQGNPQPSYRWQRKNATAGGIWTDVPSAKYGKITAELDHGNSVELKCVAENNVKGQPHSSESPEVTVTKHGTIIRVAIGVGIAVGVLLMGAVGGVAYKKNSG